jgi:hypothetical protein
MKSEAEIQAAKTSELVAFYNKYNEEKPVKKFADRATAEKRCIALLDDPRVNADPVSEAPKSLPGQAVDLELDAEVEHGLTVDQTLEAVSNALGNVEDVAHMAKDAIETGGEITAPKGPGSAIFSTMLGLNAAIENANAPKDKQAKSEGGKKFSDMFKGARSSNSAGVAASWADPEVVAARMQRDGVSVTVDGVTNDFKSTRAAFRHYRLPDSKHIRFRMKLKASREEVFEQNNIKYLFKIL